MLTDFLKLQIPDSEKTLEWYKYQCDRIIPVQSVLTVTDFEEMKKLYEFKNNDLTLFRDEIDYYCGSLAEFGASEEDLIPYNPIPQKLEILKGEMLARGNTLKIILLTAKAIQNKNEQLYNLIKQSVEQELQIVIEQQKQQLEGKSPEEIEQYVQELRTMRTPEDLNIKDFLSESEILYNKLLDFTYADQDILSKKLECIDDAATVDRFFVYPGWKHGRPYIQMLNPLHVGFDKNPNTPFIQHGDYVWYRDEITVADALQEYANRLSEADIDKLAQFATTVNAIDARHASQPVFDYTQYYSLLEYFGERLKRGVGTHQGRAVTRMNVFQTLWRVHLEFKAFREVVFLTIKDDYNETITLDVKANVIPKEASLVKYTNRWGEQSEKYVWAAEDGTNMEAEVMWIPRRYEVTRLGNDIYVDFREVPFQPDYGDNPFSRFELSYKGGIINSRNAKSVSLVQRALPYAFQYMAAKRLQDREMAKYVGQERAVDVDQIPDELALDHENDPAVDQDRALRNDVIARKTGTRYYSGSRSANGLPVPPTRSAGVTYNVVDTSPQLLNLQQLCGLLNVEVGMAMGIPPQREAMTLPNTNVSDNRQALVQASLSTQSVFFFVDKVWAHVLNEHLLNLKTYLQNLFATNPKLTNHQFEYILPNGTKELLQVTPNQVEQLEDIGLYIFNSGKDKMYFDIMLANLQPIAQNAGQGAASLSAILKGLVSTNSVEEVHKLISIEEQRQHERMLQQQQQQNEAQQQLVKLQQDMAKFQSNLELSVEMAKLEEQRNTRLQAAEIESTRFKQQQDVNSNEIADSLEQQREQQQWESAEKEKDRQLQLQLAKEKQGVVKANK